MVVSALRLAIKPRSIWVDMARKKGFMDRVLVEI